MRNRLLPHALRPSMRMPSSLAMQADPFPVIQDSSATSATPGIDRAFTPLGYEPGYEYPLIVWLPDPCGRRFDLGRVMKRVSLRNFLAVEPAMWVPEDGGTSPLHQSHASIDHGKGPEDGVWRAIERMQDNASVHPKRIYLVGQGAGGTEAFRIACRHPKAFAGVISLGGPFPLAESLFSQLAAVRQLPMLLCCHRNASSLAARHTDATLRLFHAAGAMLAMRIYPGTNELSKAILCDVNRWLMDEVCGTPAALQSQCARDT
jgi:phospholipase/carboxylesterase